jgi:hypothetical protein
VDFWLTPAAEGGSGFAVALVAIAGLAASGAITGGTVFYAGLLDHGVGEHHFGHEARDVREVLRTLPWLRLFLASILLVGGTAAATAAFVVPGFLLFTLFALVGPLINIEREREHGVTSGFRRSAELVRPAFVAVFVMVTLPMTAEHLLVHELNEIVWKRPVAEAFLTSAILAITVGALIALIEVTLAHSLLERERASR